MKKPGPLERMSRVSRRHKNDEGMCRSCGQPWPCDVDLVIGIVREILSRG